MNADNERNRKAALRRHIRRLGVQVALFALLVAVAVALYALTRS